ncbi:MAG TPA: DUF3501 family protein [Rhizobacter sp.]
MLTATSPLATTSLLHEPIRHPQRRQLAAHRRSRSLALGPAMWLQFEDDLTLEHQIDEVLRTEGDASTEARERERALYAHLRPDGRHWKATLLIGLPDADERVRDLPMLNEAAHRLYVQLPRLPRVHAQANEDLPDRHLTRLSAVHFLRFEFPAPLRVALLAGADASIGCAHDQYAWRRVIPMALLEQLRCDLALSGR